MLLYPYGIRDAGISYVGALPNGDRWVCVRARTGGTADAPAVRRAIAVMSPDTTLIGTQTDCPTCQAAGLRWLPFPELDPQGDASP